ncbi:hypothetical protein [Variovorax sp. PCZ-1]|uniref:hypothetical protein n=1 Tax=Variovorax sp. PCZ-1 TaxID=2835533 RepID=UPI001BCF2E73|nr:hypothetical protein [Variovorax sp. PCZ-1]MBS7806148.1 hypothetical protein [Variovorax sp. PCZ-1]
MQSALRATLIALMLLMVGCAATVRSYQQGCEQRFAGFLEMCDCLRSAVNADPRLASSTDYRVNTYLQAMDELSAAVEAKAIEERTARLKLSDIYMRLVRGETIAPTGGSTAGGSGSSSNAPCVTGYCGPVNVQGYYRKDGTYVRPHTRSRGRK